jgi:hypothetical protein
MTTSRAKAIGHLITLLVTVALAAVAGHAPH